MYTPIPLVTQYNRSMIRLTKRATVTTIGYDQLKLRIRGKRQRAKCEQGKGKIYFLPFPLFTTRLPSFPRIENLKLSFLSPVSPPRIFTKTWPAPGWLGFLAVSRFCQSVRSSTLPRFLFLLALTEAASLALRALY